jgi:hypothetical protein
MYKCGYGFHVQLAPLLMASLIWRDGLRTFRLLKERHRRYPVPRSLLSLPSEVIALIEDHLSASLHSHQKSTEPFFTACTCEEVYERLHSSAQFTDALKNYAEEDPNSTLHVDDDMIEAFYKTQKCQDLIGDFLETHWQEDDCPSMSSEFEHWQQIVFNTSLEESDTLDLVRFLSATA